MKATSLPALFRQQADHLGSRTALRFRQFGMFRNLSWYDYHEQVTATAAGLILQGIQPGDRVATLAENRAEWLIADLASMMIGAVTVPLHASLSPRQVQFQLQHAGARWLFLSSRCQSEKVRAIRAELPNLVGCAAFDGPELADFSWAGFQQRGRSARPGLLPEIDRRCADLQLSNLASIMYTSGTTGDPKGVMLTQGNLLSNAESIYSSSPLPAEGVYLNWLPFSHIYARTVDVYGTLIGGVTLCLADSAESVVRDIAELQPTHMSGVPRFYEKVYALTHSDDPALSRRRLRAVFGSRIDWLSSGGAPLSPAIAQAYHDAGLLLLQGYGLTESSPVITFNRKDSNRIGSVGQAIPDVEVRIADDGEILTRGPHVMQGYWNDPQATAIALEAGWLHTGDLGHLDEAGFLHITGRKKDLLVLSNGKKIVPNYIEGLLLADPCIEQVIVCGEGRNFLTALIVPHWPLVRQALSLDSLPEDSLVRDPRVESFMGLRIEQALAHVSQPEQVRRFVLIPRPFSVASDEMTVSLKLRRTVILDHHRSAIESLYQEK